MIQQHSITWSSIRYIYMLMLYETNAMWKKITGAKPKVARAHLVACVCVRANVRDRKMTVSPSPLLFARCLHAQRWEFISALLLF